MSEETNSDRELGRLTGIVEALVTDNNRRFDELSSGIKSIAQQFETYAVNHDKKDSAVIANLETRISALEIEKTKRESAKNSLFSQIIRQMLMTVAAIFATGIVAFVGWSFIQFVIKSGVI